MKNIPLLLGTIAGTVILIVVIAVMSSGGSQVTDDGQQVFDQSLVMGDARHTYQAESTAEIGLTTPQATSGAEAADPSSGTESESDSQENQELVTIVEFSDFQCPACKAALPAVKQVLAAYPGQVQLVYRHFPLDSIHPNARLAAVASEAVASLDETKFWGFHDALFENQQTWANTRSRDELKNTFATYAVELGIDRTQFLERMEDSSIADLVNLDVSSGTQLGVNATPTFYVNGIKTSAPQLQATVESVLNK